MIIRCAERIHPHDALNPRWRSWLSIFSRYVVTQLWDRKFLPEDFAGSDGEDALEAFIAALPPLTELYPVRANDSWWGVLGHVSRLGHPRLTPDKNVATILHRLWTVDYKDNFRPFGAYRFYHFCRLTTFLLWKNEFTPADFDNPDGHDAIAALLSAYLADNPDPPDVLSGQIRSPEWHAVMTILQSIGSGIFREL